MKSNLNPMKSPRHEFMQGQVADVMKNLSEGVPVVTDPSFPDEVNARLLVVEATAEANIKKTDPVAGERVKQLLAVALRASTSAKKVMWLHKAADVSAAAVAPVSACRTGCDSCCHIEARISRLEARVLARAIGREIVEPEHHRPVNVQGYEAPCPFLVDHQCSVYAVRPTVCRTHFNLDEDDLLCRLTPGLAIPVPYYDTRIFAFTGVAMEPDESQWADIRQWFQV